MLALVRFSLRQLAGRDRWFALGFWLLIALLPAMLAGLIVNLAPRQGETASLAIFENLTLALILPALALILASGLFREEIQSQTIVYLYLKPVARSILVLAKFIAALIVLLGLMSLSVIATVAIFQDGRVGVFLTVGAIAVLAYSAFFMTLSLFVGRAVLWGFGYLLLWEGFLANISRPASFLSLRRHLLGLEQVLLGKGTEISLETALLVLMGVVILGLVISIWRLSSMEFAGSAVTV